MKIAQLDGCCGIYTIFDFGHTTTSNFTEPLKVEDVKKQLTEYEKYWYYRNAAFFLVALNDEQRKVYKTPMKEMGYKCIQKAFHPNHGTTIYLYTKNLQRHNAHRTKK